MFVLGTLLRRVAAGAALVAPLAACSSVDPAPFAKYADTTSELSSKAQAMFEVDIEWARKGFFTEVVELGDPKAMKDIVLVYGEDDDPLAPRMREAPVYMAIQDAATYSEQLNGAFSEYATTLATLAGNKVVSQDTFDDLATGLNGSLREAAAGLKIELPEAATFSVVAAEAFRAYIESRRRAALVDALTAAQPTVEAWSELGADAAERMGLDIYAEYDKRRQVLQRTFATAGSAKSKAAAAKALLDLAETTSGVFRSLRELRRGYRKMPKAHGDLIAVARNEQTSLQRLRDYYAHVQHLRELRGRLETDE